MSRVRLVNRCRENFERISFTAVLITDALKREPSILPLLIFVATPLAQKFRNFFSPRSSLFRDVPFAAIAVRQIRPLAGGAWFMCEMQQEISV